MRMPRRVERLGIAEARQGGAIGAHQEDRLDQVALRLLDGERGEVAVVERALRHHPVDGEAELLVDLRDGEFRHARIAATRARRSSRWALAMAFSPPLTATYMAQAPSPMRVERGRAASSVGEQKKTSTPRG